MLVQGVKLEIDYLVSGYELSHDVHPDTVCCVHTTKVVGNQIQAHMYFKYTENRALRRAVENSTRDTSALRLCPTPQSDTEHLLQHIASKPLEEQLALLEIVENAEEIAVYGVSRLTLTFDDFTKKIACFDMRCEYTSFEAVART